MAAFAATSSGTDAVQSKRHVLRSSRQFTEDDFDEPREGGIVSINVGGEVFQTYARTLDRFPESLLGDKTRRALYWNDDAEEYHFDRNRQSFDYILYFYQSGGELHQPASVPFAVFVDEIHFFDLPAEIVDDLLIANGFKDMEDEDEMNMDPSQKELWFLVEHPNSSGGAKAFAILSLSIIVLSLVISVLESMKGFGTNDDLSSHGNSTHTGQADRSTNAWIKDLNSGIAIWFTIEVTLRFISCPNKLKFLINGGTIIDLLAIFPFYASLIISSSNISTINAIRVARVARVLKLMRHSRGLQVIANTLRSSATELFLLAFFLLIVVLICASLLYFTEKSDPETLFKSIPHSAWYALVSLTTLGYGDLAPKTAGGRMVGSFTVLFGIVLMALPAPTIVCNFNHYRKLEENRKQAEEEKAKKRSRNKNLEETAVEKRNKRPAEEIEALFRILDIIFRFCKIFKFLQMTKTVLTNLTLFLSRIRSPSESEVTETTERKRKEQRNEVKTDRAAEMEKRSTMAVTDAAIETSTKARRPRNKEEAESCFLLLDLIFVILRYVRFFEVVKRALDILRRFYRY